MSSYSVSVSTESGIAADHDQRAYTPESAAYELRGRNVIIKGTTDHVAEFNEFFRQAIEDYNDAQKRADRKKSLDYYHECRPKGKTPVEQEMVIQIGNRDTLGVLTPGAYEQGIDEEYKQARAAGRTPPDLTPWLSNNPDRAKLKAVLQTVGEGLQARYPNFHFTTIVLHDDEISGTCHLHAGGFFHASGYQQAGKAAGVQTRWSPTRGLQDMGFVDEAGHPDMSLFYQDIRGYVAEEMEHAGYRRKYMSNNKAHEHTDVYTMRRDLEAREAALKARQRVLDAREAQICQDGQRAAERLAEAEEAISEAEAVKGKALEVLDRCDRWLAGKSEDSGLVDYAKRTKNKAGVSMWDRYQAQAKPTRDTLAQVRQTVDGLTVPSIEDQIAAQRQRAGMVRPTRKQLTQREASAGLEL